MHIDHLIRLSHTTLGMKTDGQWQQISSSKPKWIATGKMLEAIQSAGSLEYPEADENILDLSQKGLGAGAIEGDAWAMEK